MYKKICTQSEDRFKNSQVNTSIFYQIVVDSQIYFRSWQHIWLFCYINDLRINRNCLIYFDIELINRLIVSAWSKITMFSTLWREYAAGDRHCDWTGALSLYGGQEVPPLYWRSHPWNSASDGHCPHERPSLRTQGHLFQGLHYSKGIHEVVLM